MRKFINIALADGIKRVKITFFRHKLVKGAAFLNAAVFHDQNAVITAQKSFVKSVSYHNPCNAFQAQYIA